MTYAGHCMYQTKDHDAFQCIQRTFISYPLYTCNRHGSSFVPDSNSYAAAKILEKGSACVGCSQFFSSYTACGGDSIMWNVYAKRVCGLRFFSDLCSTLPWMITKSPGSHVSRTYAPPGGGGASAAGISSSKPVPPAGRRTKRLTIGAILCEPGRKDRAPFSDVHFSKANQKPSALGGSVYKNVESLCSGTSPPMCVCFVITIDCKAFSFRLQFASA